MSFNQFPKAGVSKSGTTADGHLAVWNGTDIASIKDGGAATGGTVTSVSSANGDITVATGTTTPVLTSVGRTTPTASTPAGRDASANLRANNNVGGYATTATAAGTTTLVVGSAGTQTFTGATTQTVQLPVVTTLPQAGFSFEVINNSSGALTVNSSGSNLVQTMVAGSRATFTANKITADTTAAAWDINYNSGSSGITNSAGANVIPKSDGTNLVASQISDDGATVVIGRSGTIGTIQLDSPNGATTIGDVNGAGSGTTGTFDDANAVITFSASPSVIAITGGGIGDDANITLASPKGVAAQGTNTNNNAAVSYIGEFLTASLASGSATSLSTGTAKTIISVDLTAGDWDVWAVADYVPAAATTTAVVSQGISTTTNTLDAQDTFTAARGGNLSGTVLGSLIAENTPTRRLSLASTTTVYLVAKASFAVSTMTGYGSIFARRRR